MTTQNTPTSYGLLARAFHWLTALVILTAIPLGLIANGIEAGPDTIVQKTLLFSVHKTIGVLAFFLGAARILWALGQTRPVALHPERRLETALADTVHWMLYLSLMLVPLSGWVHHAAVDGFAPIYWPFGQSLPFVPKSEGVAGIAGGTHWLFTKLLAASVILHILGALKHHLIDRDNTLRRMTRGIAAPAHAKAAPHRFAPLIVALAVYAGAGVAVVASASGGETVAAPQAQTATAGNWQVETGEIAFGVQQMGAAVEGRFANWTAEITYDDSVAEGPAGVVVVDIDLASLSIGSVTDQAKGAEFFDVANHPKARFTADLIAGPDGLQAQGALTLRGVDRPVTLPFTLQINQDRAEMTAEVRLDRRDFGIGAGYGDEETVGFAVTVKITLTATRT